MTRPVVPGLEVFLDQPPADIRDKRIGLLANPASVDRHFNHAASLINRRFKGQLTALFSPQHGFYAEKQDNMIESSHFTEPELNIPVFSLYSRTRKPTREMFDHIDILVVDIQDVGTRVYTFIYTISFCLEVAARMNKKVIILDRPNPIGGLQVEGNLLEQEFTSFVGRFPIPMRHGLTVGEICAYFNQYHGIGADLEVIPMKNWNRKMYFNDTGLPWVMPSPNLPTPASCLVYPGQVIFEGTNISEGRGTTLPFEQFGAPYLDTAKIRNRVQPLISGAILREVSFEPTSGKWQGQVCRGFQIHVTSLRTYKPYLTSLLLLQAIIRYHESEFELKSPPYEYEYKKQPIDLILGSKMLRKQVVSQANLPKMEQPWQIQITQFKKKCRKVMQYA